jgi:hypothetical protein
LIFTIFMNYFAARISKRTLFTFSLAGPPSPWSLESWDWGCTTTQIFELEGLICKIFRTKELAVPAIISRLTVQLQG